MCKSTSTALGIVRYSKTTENEERREGGREGKRKEGREGGREGGRKEKEPHASSCFLGWGGWQERLLNWQKSGAGLQQCHNYRE